MKGPRGMCAAVKPQRTVNKQAGCCCRINPGSERCFCSNCHVNSRYSTCSALWYEPTFSQYFPLCLPMFPVIQDIIFQLVSILCGIIKKHTYQCIIFVGFTWKNHPFWVNSCYLFCHLFFFVWIVCHWLQVIQHNFKLSAASCKRLGADKLNYNLEVSRRGVVEKGLHAWCRRDEHIY